MIKLLVYIYINKQLYEAVYGIKINCLCIGSGISRVKCPSCGNIQTRRRLETSVPCPCGTVIDLTEIPLSKISKLQDELQELLCVRMDWRKGIQVRMELEVCVFLLNIIVYIYLCKLVIILVCLDYSRQICGIAEPRTFPLKYPDLESTLDPGRQQEDCQVYVNRCFKL